MRTKTCFSRSQYFSKSSCTHKGSKNKIPTHNNVHSKKHDTNHSKMTGGVDPAKAGCQDGSRLAKNGLTRALLIMLDSEKNGFRLLSKTTTKKSWGVCGARHDGVFASMIIITHEPNQGHSWFPRSLALFALDSRYSSTRRKNKSFKEEGMRWNSVSGCLEFLEFQKVGLPWVGTEVFNSTN